MIHVFLRDGENALEIRKKLGTLVGRHIYLKFKGWPKLLLPSIIITVESILEKTTKSISISIYV